MKSAAGSFWEWISFLDSGERTGLMVLCVFAFVATLTVITVTIYKMHRNRLEDALKRELLDRGMSADEIATVIRATPSKRGSALRGDHRLDVEASK